MDSLQLKGNLKKEYNYPITTKIKFSEYYQGKYIQEFIDLPEIVYNEWRYYSRMEYNVGTFDEEFKNFKDSWQYNTSETQQVFNEMKLLSNTLTTEWRIKYTFHSIYIYESYESCRKGDYESKTKAQLWDEFKKIWDLDPENYSEYLLSEYQELIYECDKDSETIYFENYPRTFWEFREDSNYHSYDSYSVLEQYRICQEWKDLTYELY